MQTFSFSLTNARLAFLLTITRNDATIIRLTNASQAITIGSVTWTPVANITIGDVTNTNAGTLPTFSFNISAGSSLISALDIDNGLFEEAAVTLEITDAANPVSKDFQFTGRMLGNIDYNLPGQISFEVLSFFAIQRDIFIRQYGIPCDADFGDPRRCKIPTFPDIEVGSSDLHDVARLETIAVGDRRRFRFSGTGFPSDYANVYLEATSITTGITAAGAPTPSSTVGTTYVDGGVTWTTRNAWLRYAQVGTIYDSKNFTLTNYTEPRATDNTWLTPGRFAVRTGYCKNMVADIRTWSQSAQQVETLQTFAALMASGDWLEIAPDCDKTLVMCVNKYANANNYRGIPYLIGSKLVTSTIVPGVTFTDTTLNGTPVNVTLSNGNLTATHNSASAGGARTASVKSTGKFYFEVTLTTINGALTGPGLLRSSAPLSDITSGSSTTTVVYVGNGGGVPFGAIFTSSADTGKHLGALANGDRIDIAVDIGAVSGQGHAWFRKNSGNWNGDASADPATDAGSVSMAGTTNSGASTCGPAFGFAGTSEVFTANFGASAFSGAVPSGFTSGWTPT